MEDLSTIIEDSITDVTLPVPETDLDLSPEPVEPMEVTSAVEPVNDPIEAPEAPLDDFDKKFGLTPTSPTGRENRIPYSRVKKITEKAVTDAKSSWQKDLEASHTPITKYQELETKNRD